METKRIRITKATRSMTKAEEIGYSAIALMDIAENIHSRVVCAKLKHRKMNDLFDYQIEQLSNIYKIDTYKDIKVIKKITKDVHRQYGHREKEFVDMRIRSRYEMYLSKK